MTQKQLLVSTDVVFSGTKLNIRNEIWLMKKNGQDIKVQQQVAEHAPIVVLVPIDQKGNIYLVRQFRRPTKGLLLETPAGTIEAGEEPRNAALRELKEETGYAAKEIINIGGFWIAPGWSDGFAYIYVCTGLEPAYAEPDEDEDINLVVTPLHEIPNLIKDGTICDAKSVAALQMVLFLHPEQLTGSSLVEGT